MADLLTLRRLALACFGCVALFLLDVASPTYLGGPTMARAQVPAEFQAALQPYGAWRRHPRWGIVWSPAGRPRGWRPYTHGQWLYTEEWGWYWISDRDEEDWGWVAYHYGRWVFDRGMGWVWVRGDEWAPAWVNWRRGGDVIGWAALPPDALIGDYDAEPALWSFVQPRHLTDPRLRAHVLAAGRAGAALRATVVVNRTLAVANARIAVNAGVDPSVVAAVARAPIATYRVAPRVIAGTQGVAGAVAVKPQDLSRRASRGASRFAASAQRTATTIGPAASVPKPEPLAKGERGRLGTHPPRAAQSSVNDAASAPPQRQVSPPPSAPRPVTPPEAVKPPAPPVSAPPVFVPPRRSDEPQAKPQRPVAPQTPPPPPPTRPGPPRKPGAKAADQN